MPGALNVIAYAPFVVATCCAKAPPRECPVRTIL